MPSGAWRSTRRRPRRQPPRSTGSVIVPGVSGLQMPVEVVEREQLDVCQLLGLRPRSAAGVKATASASAAIATSVLLMLLPLPIRLRIQEQLGLENEGAGCRRCDEPGRLVLNLADEGHELVVSHLRHAVEVLLELRARVVARDRPVLAVVARAAPGAARAWPRGRTATTSDRGPRGRGRRHRDSRPGSRRSRGRPATARAPRAGCRSRTGRRASGPCRRRRTSTPPPAPGRPSCPTGSPAPGRRAGRAGRSAARAGRRGAGRR